MLGRSHNFLGITSTYWGVNVPCSRTQRGLTRVGLEPPTSGSGVRGINHQATALLTYASESVSMTTTISWTESLHVPNKAYFTSPYSSTYPQHSRFALVVNERLRNNKRICFPPLFLLHYLEHDASSKSMHVLPSLFCTE